MKIVVVKWDKAVPEIRDIDGELESMQSIVGGYIEVGKVLMGQYLVMVNEEAILQDLPMNRGLYHGNFFVCKQDGADMVGLNDAEAVQWKDFFDMNERMKSRMVDKLWLTE